MKRNWRIILMVCTAIGLVGSLSGCATFQKERLANSSTDYNLVVEKVQNEMLLLNIVRASKRRPMYFTSFNQLSGSMEYTFQTGSITIPFGKIGAGLDGAYSVAPSVSYSTKPSFIVNILDTKEFIAAIMSPVTLDKVYYYLKGGWHKEELWHILIKRIETPTEKGWKIYNNFPGDKKTFEEEFQPKLREFLKCELEEKETSKENKKESEYYFVCDGKELSISGPDTSGSYLLQKEGTNLYKIHLRSPEAMLYYLGQILRAEAQINFVPKIMLEKCESPVSLFIARKANDNDKAPIVSVDYEGTKYIIPGDVLTESDVKCPSDNSLHVLSLISQLISLQKSIKDVPITGVVNVIGR